MKGNRAATTSNCTVQVVPQVGNVRGHLSSVITVALDDDDAAVLDWGATRFTLAMVVKPGRGEDPRVWIAADRELGTARVERLATARSGVAYGATPSVPRLRNDRALVYLACGLGPEVTVEILRFYVSRGGIDDARVWGRSGAPLLRHSSCARIRRRTGCPRWCPSIVRRSSRRKARRRLRADIASILRQPMMRVTSRTARSTLVQAHRPIRLTSLAGCEA